MGFKILLSFATRLDLNSFTVMLSISLIRPGSRQARPEVPQHCRHVHLVPARLSGRPQSDTGQAARAGRRPAEEGPRTALVQDCRAGQRRALGGRARPTSRHHQIGAVGVRGVARGGNRESEHCTASGAFAGSVLCAGSGGERVQSSVHRRKTGKVSYRYNKKQRNIYVTGFTCSCTVSRV